MRGLQPCAGLLTRRGRLSRRVAAPCSLVALAVPTCIIGWAVSITFVGRLPQAGRVASVDRTHLGVFPWEAREGNVAAERAYSTWAAAYPAAVPTGEFLGEKCDKGIVIARFEALSQMLGQDIALDIALKEPIVLLRSTDSVRECLEYLKGLETVEQQGQAVKVVQKNPRLLTIGSFEFQRTKASLESLAFSASVIDFLRPIGAPGLAVVIFGSFIVLILVLRPIIYGVNGQQSLVSTLLEPVTSMLPSLRDIPSPSQFLEGYGINLASFVVIIPIYQVLSAVKSKIESGKSS